MALLVEAHFFPSVEYLCALHPFPELQLEAHEHYVQAELPEPVPYSHRAGRRADHGADYRETREGPCDLRPDRLRHISTECVFSGKIGMYKESDLTDARDLYGRTKALGEVDYLDYGLTVRTSLIGREINTRYSLLEWFLSQSGTVKGFQKAIFSGFPTGAVSQLMNDIILPHPSLHGLYHVSAEPINKYDLLLLFKEAYNHPIEIEPDTVMMIDRSLDSSRFRVETGFIPTPWPDMVAQMAADTTPDENWK